MSSSSSAPLTIALSSGCPAGVGPELMVKAIALLDDDRLPAATRLLWCASAALFVEGARRAGVVVSRDGNDVVVGHRRVFCAVDDTDDDGRDVVAGVVTDAAVVGQRTSLLRAIEAAAHDDADAIVTGPVRKAALLVEGVQWPGQTELVHAVLRDDDGPPLMVFSGAPFILGLHTVHMALRDVAASLHTDGVARSIRQLAHAARQLLGVDTPRVVVLGVNPHAGEGGLFGDEEIRVVGPAIERVRAEGIDVVGSVPADGFFADVARHSRSSGVAAMPGVHAVLAMHHDQGLAPYKLLGDGDGVNITWGLRVPRTSPDHGTADSIAGKGIADPSSTMAAIAAAVVLGRGFSDDPLRSATPSTTSG